MNEPTPHPVNGPTRFSIIVPLYNKAAFVAASLRSILEQAHPHFEVVVVDDGSTDGSADVVRGFRDDRIRLVTQANQGVSAAKNRGIDEARHDLIAFLDADDWWDRDYLRQMARLVEAHPELSLYCASYARVEHGIAVPSEPTFRTAGSHTVFDPIEESVRAGTFVMPLHTSSTVIRRSILARSGAFDPAIRYYEDYDLFLRIATFSRCGRVNGKPLAFYLKDVPAGQRATGRLPPIERSLVGHLDKFDAFLPLHPSLGAYIDAFRLFNLMAYVEAGVPRSIIRPLLATTDPARFTWRHRVYYSFTPLGMLLVRLNVLRRRAIDAARNLVRAVGGPGRRNPAAGGCAAAHSR
jgi:glycosyltransferase involved in cell wall biosynthesis